MSAERERRFDWDDADARIHRVRGELIADPGFEDHPAVEVSWFGARDYCAGKGRRLPTEAEREKAARGDDKRPYPGGWRAPAPELALFGRRYNATDRGDIRPRGRSPTASRTCSGTSASLDTRGAAALCLRPCAG